MSLMYDLFENPPREGTDEPMLHARPVMSSTLKTKELADFMTRATSFTPGDLQGMLVFLADAIYSGISSSRSVYLEGIGTFSVTLKCKPVKSKHEIRSASVEVKDITFRPDPALRHKFKSIHIKRTPHSVKRKKYTDDERKSRIIRHIKAARSAGVVDVMALNQCTYAKAISDLNALLGENKISYILSGRRKVYVLS